MSRPMILHVRFSAQYPLERRPELGAKDRVDNGVQGRVKVAQPQEERHKMLVPIPVAVNSHEQRQDEKG